MKMSIVGLIVLGLVAAFSAALMMAALGKPMTRSVSSDKDREVTILVAKNDIPSVSRLHQDDLEERTMMLSEAPKGAITDSIHVIGKTLARPMLAGEPVTREALTGNPRGAEMVSSLPPGMRAVTVELRHAAGLEGLLYPGSVVDVLATFRFDRDLKEVGDAISTTLLNGVEVLAIDDITMAQDEGDDKNAGNGVLGKSKTRRVTLLVDSKQAEALQLATTHGEVSLAMRNPNDKLIADRDATLLSGGQLASLGEYLGAWVGNSTDQPEPDQASEAPQPVAPAKPVQIKPTKSNVHEWDVTVMRGDNIEVQSFRTKKENEEAIPLF